MKDKILKNIKQNPILGLIILVFVIFILYIIIFHSKNLKETDMQHHQFDLLFMQVAVSHKVLTLMMLLSYFLGLILPSIGWFLEQKKTTKAGKDLAGMKGKLDKIQKEKAFFEHKIKILENGINSAAPGGGGGGGGKKGGPPPKKKSPAKIIIGVVVLFLVFTPWISDTSEGEAVEGEKKHSIFSYVTGKMSND